MSDASKERGARSEERGARSEERGARRRERRERREGIDEDCCLPKMISRKAAVLFNTMTFIARTLNLFSPIGSHIMRKLRRGRRSKDGRRRLTHKDHHLAPRREKDGRQLPMMRTSTTMSSAAPNKRFTV